MRFLLKGALLLAAFGGVLSAQIYVTGSNLDTSTQNYTAGAYKYDFTSGQFVAPNGAANPATCAVGQLYFNTGATAGQNIYECTATNTWTQQLNGTGGATVVESSLANLVSDANGSTCTNGCTLIIPATAAWTMSAQQNITGSNVTISCQPGGTISNASSGATYSMFYFTGNNDAMSGCTLKAVAATQYPVQAVSVTGFTFTNNITSGASKTFVHLSNVAPASISGNSHSGYGFLYGENNTQKVNIVNNSFDCSTDTGTSSTCVGFHSTSTGNTVKGIVISHNQIKATGLSCIEIGGFGGNAAQDISIIANKCEATVATTFEYLSFDQVTGLTVSSNVMQGNGNTISLNGIEVVNSSNNFTVSGNTINGSAITVDHAYSGVVVGNTMTASTQSLAITNSAASGSTNDVLLAYNVFTAAAGLTTDVNIQCNNSTATCNNIKLMGNKIIGVNHAGSVNDNGIVINHNSGTMTGFLAAFNDVCAYTGIQSGDISGAVFTFEDNSFPSGCSANATYAVPAASVILTGIQSYTAVSHQWLTSISSAGLAASTQPTFADIAAGTVAVTETVGTGGSVVASGTGSITANHYTDFPDKKYIPSANCNNATPVADWSLPTASAPTLACHTGTNVQDAYLQFADAQSAQFSFLIPDDWDSTASLDARLFFTDVSTSGTVIFQAATSCTSTTGAQSDDQAFNTAQSFGTITLATTASVGWITTLTGMTKTNCAAGKFLHVKISRTTDTATGAANVSGVQLTFRRTL